MKIIYTTCLFLLLLSSHAMADHHDNEQEQSQAVLSSGEGVILEFDHGEQADEEDKVQVEKKKPAPRAGIEMIVGGQGEDGIAKRKQLQVID